MYNGAALVTLDAQGILDIVNSEMNPYLRDVQLSDLEVVYRNSNGSFGVTSGTLADSRMAAAGAGSSSSSSGTSTTTTQTPQQTENTQPTEEQPGDQSETTTGGAQEQPGEGSEITQPEQGGQTTTQPSQSGTGGEETGGQTADGQGESSGGGQTNDQNQQTGEASEIPEWEVPVID
jgi:hypothetical protein